MRKKREIEDLTKDQRTIFVSQLVKKVTEKNLENFFNQIGEVRNIIMLRDKITGHHKGFAYVEMADLDSIPNCLLFNNVVPEFQKFPILVKASEAEKNFLFKKVKKFSYLGVEAWTWIPLRSHTRLGKLRSGGGGGGSGSEWQLLRTIFGDDEQQSRRGDGDGCQGRYGCGRYAAVYRYVFSMVVTRLPSSYSYVHVCV